MLLAEFGVPTPRGQAAFTVDEAAAAARELGGPVWVVKAQIHAGGRGQGGGVRVVHSVEEVAEAADEILGRRLITPQTGPGGRIVKRIYIEEGCDIAHEYYLSMLVDRARGADALIASTEGGMDIETVAAATPEKIITIALDAGLGLQPFHARRVAFALGLVGEQTRRMEKILRGVYNAGTELDASLVEINPLAVTTAGRLLALDAKMNFDDNSLFRQPRVAALRDAAEEDPAERAAAEQGLNYIKLDGAIGCMVNGAGLAMATMDIIKNYGGAPANFLDVGGGASVERVTAAVKIILADTNVKSILVNIFGGIMRCDIIAEGIVAASRAAKLTAPLVVRLAGTHVKQGGEILRRSGLPIQTADDLADAAQKAVAAAGGK